MWKVERVLHVPQVGRSFLLEIAWVCDKSHIDGCIMQLLHSCQESSSHWIWSHSWWSLFLNASFFHDCEQWSVLSHDVLWEWQLGVWMNPWGMNGGVLLPPWEDHLCQGRHQAGIVCYDVEVDFLCLIDLFLLISLTLHSLDYNMFSTLSLFSLPVTEGSHRLSCSGPWGELEEMVCKTHWFLGFC